MPGQTANGLPYPTGTDRVMDGDDAIRALAEALDPPWLALPLASGIILRAGTTVTPGYRKVAGIVTLRGQVQKSGGGTFAGQDNLFTLPTGYRPPQTVGVPTVQDSTPTTGRTDVLNNGVGRISPAGATPTWIGLDGMSFAVTGGALTEDPETKPTDPPPEAAPKS
jgi:hypothetical protein